MGKANCQFRDSWIILKSGNGEEEAARLFLGGLHKDVTPGMVHDHFSQYCKVTAVDLKYDSSGTFRKFGFVSVENKQVAEYVCAMEHKILDKVVDVKPSWDKNESGAGGAGMGANPVLAAIAAQATTNPVMALVAQQAAAKVQAAFAGIAAAQQAAAVASLDPAALVAAQVGQGQQAAADLGGAQAAPDVTALLALIQATQASNAAGRASPY